MYHIEIADEQQRLSLDHERLQHVVEVTLREEHVAAAEISLALVDDPRIWEINREFLGHDYPTDVISFLLDDEPHAFDRNFEEFEADDEDLPDEDLTDEDLVDEDDLHADAAPEPAAAPRRAPAQEPADEAPPSVSPEQFSAAATPSPDHGTTSPRGADREFSGEIVISTDTAAREAAAYGWQPQDEVVLYLVHGLLHLCGYDDLTEPELVRMRRREVEILSRFGLIPRYASTTE